jgi:hypothetical protein
VGWLQGRVGVLLACLALLVVAGLTAFSAVVLISTLGIVVVAAGLFLVPRQTLVVTALALSLAVLLAVPLDTSDNAYRVLNVAVGCTLGMLASLSRAAGMRKVERLHRHEATLLATVTDAVVMLDGDGQVLQANQALRRLAPGVSMGQRLHDHLSHLRADGTACPGDCVLAGRLDGDRGEVDGERVGPPGAEVPVEYLAARSHDGDLVVSLRDCTQRLAAESERAALVEAAAQAVEHQRVLEKLGASLAPKVPAVDGLELDVWSRPSDAHAPSGGDLVDVSVLPDGTVVMIVVDALGHGVESVRDAWKVLYVSRSYVSVGLPLREVVARTAEAFQAESQPPVATLLAATLNPGTGAVSIAGGGHPPPLVLRSAGVAEWLDVPGRGVGTPDPGSDATVSTVLEPGDTLLLYTDGLIESSRDVVAGLLGLRASALALRHQPLDGWAERLVDAVLPAGDVPDDAVVLVARRDDQELPAAVDPAAAAGSSAPAWQDA